MMADGSEEKNIASAADVTVHFINVRKAFYDADYELLLNALKARCRTNAEPGRLLRALVHRLIGDEAGLVVVLEDYHVDPTYRDAYYSHYSHRHFSIPRHTLRVSFFDYFDVRDINGKVIRYEPSKDSDGALFEATYDIIAWTGVPNGKLRDAFVGSFVVNPVSSHFMGRTLLDPSRALHWNVPDEQGETVRTFDQAFMRLSEFELNIAGRKVSVRAFPYYRQDGELMSCAEVSLLCIGQYYSNEFHGYPTVLLSDIYAAERRHAYSRTTPSVGLNYRTLCSVMYDMGFQPELYDRGTFRDRDDIGCDGDALFRWTMHSCIESGIPVAVNVEPRENLFRGHSMVCIGHGLPKPLREPKARDRRFIIRQRAADDGSGRMEDAGLSCNVMNAADFYDTYVVMDDSQPPYSMRSIHSLSTETGLKLARYVVPLQSGMTVGAADAQSFFRLILRDASDGILRWGGDWLKENGAKERRSDVVMRVFLASSKRFKPFRVKTSPDPLRRAHYAMVPLPHYVWCCELFLIDRFLSYADPASYGDSKPCTKDRHEFTKTPMAFAEIVMDATSTPDVYPGGSILICNYPTRFGYRMPSDIDGPLKEKEDIIPCDGFPSYTGNTFRVSSLRSVSAHDG